MSPSLFDASSDAANVSSDAAGETSLPMDQVASEQDARADSSKERKRSAADSEPSMNRNPSSLPTTLPTFDAVPTGVRDVVAVFQDALANVRFPDVDLSLLEHAVAQVEASAAHVRELELQLEDARRQHEEQVETMVQKAQRAVAYARVFAEGDAAVTARLERISLGRPRAVRAPTPTAMAANAETPAPKKTRKKAAPSDALFNPPTPSEDGAMSETEMPSA